MQQILGHFHFINIVFERLSALQRDFPGLCCYGFIEFLAAQMDQERTQKLIEPNQAIVLHVTKNRGGEKGKLAYDSFPGSSRFKET